MLNLNQYAKQELNVLLKETDHKLCIEDCEDIAKLNDMCLAVTCDDECCISLLNMPVMCGCYQLMEPSIGALDWYNENIIKWFPDDILMLDCALAMIMAKGKFPRSLWDIPDKKSAKREIKRFRRSLGLTHIEVREAIKKVLPDQKEEASDEKSADTGKLVAMLCREYGNSPEYWLWEAPVSTIHIMVKDFSDRMHMEAEAVRKANAAGGKHTAPQWTPKLEKIRKLRLFKNKLREKWETKI